MKFKKAVEAASPPVDAAYRSGIQALAGSHRKQVICNDPRRLTGSIDLDSALKKLPEHANANRWDYGIGYKPENGPEQVVWVEVHTATEGEVSKILKKLQWLRDWLNGEAEQLNQMTQLTSPDLRFVWIASSNVAIPGNSRKIRVLNQNGIPTVRKYLSLE